MTSPHNKLHYQLAKKAVLLALALGLLISGLQVVFDLMKERDRIHRYINDILNSSRNAAIDAAYELDNYYAQGIVDGLAGYESIANASIYDDRNTQMAFAGTKSEDLKADWMSSFIVGKNDSYTTALLKNDSGNLVGKLKVVVDSNAVGNNFLTRARIVFFSGLIRSMVLMLIFVLLFYLVLSRPLLRTIREISQLDESGAEIGKVGSSLVERNDELGMLIDSFVKLLKRRKQAEDDLRHMAFHDSLTNLPNRALLFDRLSQAMIRAERNKYYGAILFMDIDNFKDINDSLGHPAGDKMICQVAQRLESAFRAEDTISRLGGDEFIVMLPNLGSNLESVELELHDQAQKVLGCFLKPYPVAGNELYVKPSVGITLFPFPETNSDDLLKQADTAMYQAKKSGGNGYQFYHSDMQEQVTRRMLLEKELREALLNEDLVLHYQPQCDQDGTIIAVEALVRWRHRDRGLISPAEFIPMAEATGLINEVGSWVLATACTELKNLFNKNQSGIRQLSVNVSAIQFQRENFVDEVKKVLSETGMDARRLTLEMTESVMVGEFEETVTKLNQLKAIGVSFSIDDFGTGYSSLKYLQHLPFNEIKIDHSFIKDINTEESEVAIVSTMISMAKYLKMRTVSEGVETRVQFDILKKLGCNLFQGFYLSKPIEFSELERKIAIQQITA